MRRGIVIGVGVLAAGVATLVFLALALAIEGNALRPETVMRFTESLVYSLSMLDPDEAGAALAAGFHMLWLTLVIVCFLPVTIAALVGEAARSRSFVLLASVAGGTAAALPTFAQALFGSASAPRIEGDVTLVLFLSGVVGAAAYRLVGGHKAEDHRPRLPA